MTTLDLRSSTTTLRLSHNGGTSALGLVVGRGPEGPMGPPGPPLSGTALAAALSSDPTVQATIQTATTTAIGASGVPHVAADTALHADEFGQIYDGDTKYLEISREVAGYSWGVFTRSPADVNDPVRRLYGITSAGHAIDRSGTASTSLTDIYIDADSIGRGTNGNGTTWGGVLYNLLRGRDSTYSGRLLNYAIGGENSRTILARCGGSALLATVTGGSIPASGPVAVTLTYEDGTTTNETPAAGQAALNPLIQDNIGWNPCSLVGDNGTEVTGVLARTGVGTYSFTRLSAGAAVSSKFKTPVVTWSSRNNMRGTHLIAVGQNDNDGSNYAARHDRIQTFVDRLQAGKARFLIQGVMSGGTSTRATEEVDAVRRWGRHFLNMRDWMCSQAAFDVAGLTPTSSDLTQMAAGTVPDQWFAGDSALVHPSAAGYTAMGYAYFRRFIELGWI